MNTHSLKFSIIHSATLVVLSLCSLACGTSEKNSLGGITVTNPADSNVPSLAPLNNRIDLKNFPIEFFTPYGFSVFYSSKLSTLNANTRGITIQNMGQRDELFSRIDIRAIDPELGPHSPHHFEYLVQTSCEKLNFDFKSQTKRVESKMGTLYRAERVGSDGWVARYFWILSPNQLVIQIRHDIHHSQIGSAVDKEFLQIVSRISFDLRPPRIKSVTLNSNSRTIEIQTLDFNQEKTPVVGLFFTGNEENGIQMSTIETARRIGPNKFEVRFLDLYYPGTNGSYTLKKIGIRNIANNWTYLAQKSNHPTYSTFSVPGGLDLPDVPEDRWQDTNISVIELHQ